MPLRGASLTMANLTMANLTMADLTDTNLEGTNLEWAQLRGSASRQLLRACGKVGLPNGSGSSPSG